MVARPRHPTIKGSHASRARIGGARPVSGGARDAADRSCYTGDARPTLPSPRMAVSRNVGMLHLRSPPPHPNLCGLNFPFFFSRDYYAALLRTHQSFVAPTQGKLLNYVQRVPLGVVAQITVRRNLPTKRVL